MILLIGFGYWGNNLARNFSKELYAICDNDQDNLDKAKKNYPHLKYFRNIDDALLDNNIKAVLIATKASTHYELAMKCLKADKDIWIEKPITEKLEDLIHLKNFANHKNKIIFVDHTFCYHPAVRKIKTLDIGSPLYYDSTRISLGLFQNDVDVLLDLAIHDASIINFLYPDLILEDKQIIKNYHVNDKANQTILNLKFTNNFTATINCNWVSPVKKRQIIITGSKNSIVYDDIDSEKIKVYSTGQINTDYNSNQLGDMFVPKVETSEALYNARTHFLECISNRKEPITGISSVQKVMEWLL